MLLLNAFSLNMVGRGCHTMHFDEITLDQARELLAEHGLNSAVGHESTAALFSALLGRHVPANRATLSLTRGDRALVGQYSGPRLEEGATELPPGASIRWLEVSLF
jgi:hypothetical protein